MKFRRLSVKDLGINNIEAISFLIPAGWKAEGGAQWFPEYIRGVETYKNPFEDRSVQLPSGYGEARVNARGEYLLTSKKPLILIFTWAGTIRR